MFILKGIKNFLSDLYHNRIAILCIIIYMSVTQYLFHSVCPIAILLAFHVLPVVSRGLGSVFSQPIFQLLFR